MFLKTYSPISGSRLPVLAFALAAVVVYAAAARSWHAARVVQLHATLQGGPGRERLETERITLRPDGFEPAQITRPQGEFILAADNLSGLREVALILEHERGERVRERRVSLEQFKWRARLDLHPGRYVVREADHPGWTCVLTITPK
jgi:hypothetical protein